MTAPRQPVGAAESVGQGGGSGALGRLARQSGVYAVGNMLVKAGGLLLAPLYLNLLTEAGYGYLELLDTTARLVVLCAGLGIATGVLRFMTTDTYAADHEATPFTALVTTGLAAAVTVIVLWLAAPWLAGLLVDDPEQAWLVRLMAIYAGFKIVAAVPMMLLRVHERPGLYVTATVAEWGVLLGAVVVLLALQGRGLRGVMEAYALSAAVGGSVLVAGLLAHVPRRFQRRLGRRLVRFGMPLVLAGLASMFLNVGDRYLLKVFADAEAVGVYGWAARLSGVLNMLFVQSFQMAFAVIGLKALATATEGTAVYRRVFRHYVIWTGWGVLGLSLLALDVTHLVTDRTAYLAVDTLALPIAFGFMAYGIYYIVVNILYAAERTRVIAWTVAAAAVGNAALNVVLIPSFGVMGAALATTAAYGLLVAIAVREARRHQRVDYAWGKLAWVVGLVLGLWGLGQPTVDWEVPARLAVRSLLILAYLPLILVARLYTPREVAQGWAWLVQWWGRRKN